MKKYGFICIFNYHLKQLKSFVLNELATLKYQLDERQNFVQIQMFVRGVNGNDSVRKDVENCETE